MVAISQKVITAIPALASLFYQQAPASFDSVSNSYAIAQFDSDIKGYVKFEPSSSGSVNVDVKLTGLPDEGGPFMYHIHEFPVPSNGDCYATGGHLNPFQGITPCAIAEKDSMCEVGDLSGKHGFINGMELETSYNEKYISLNPANVAFVGGLSVTIHKADNSRIACSNIIYGGNFEIEKKIRKNTSNSSNSTTSTSIGAAVVQGSSYGVFAAGVAGLAAVLL